MAESVQIAVFQGGELKVTATGEQSTEVVLALPLSRLLVKMVRVPAENRDDPVAYATPLVTALSPYPDEPLTVSCETIRETETEKVVLAAAVPESSLGDVGEALDAGKYGVTRIDATALGELRERWGEIGADGADVRRLVLLGGADCISLFVLDNGEPSAIRALSNGGDLKREVMLSLLEAEEFGGARALAEIVAVGEVPTEGLETFGPVRRLPAGEPSVAGLIERAKDPASLDVLPSTWRTELTETRFRRAQRKFLAGAAFLWILVAAVAFGGPMVIGAMEGHQQTLRAEHRKKYDEVKNMLSRIELVRRYSDHDRGALEILKAVSDRLPEGVELGSWNYKRGEGVKFAGESPDTESVYRLKDNLMAIGAEGDAADKVFADVELNGPSATRNGQQRFDINCLYQKEVE